MKSYSPPFVLIFFLICFQSFSQSSYSDYSSSDKTNVYYEDFSSYSSTWVKTIEGKSKSYVEDGELIFKSLNSSAHAKYRTIDDMNWSGNWELEMSIRFITGKETSAMDMIWNREYGKDGRYHFGYTAGNKYNISTYDGSKYNPIVSFQKTDNLSKYGSNRFTVRKVGSTYYCFVNRRFVKSFSYKTMDGDDIGMMVPPNTTIAIDFIRVSKLKSNSYAGNSSTLLRGNSYIGVMTKNSGYGIQKWKVRENWPKDDISTDWDADYYITDVSYDNNKWSLVMSKSPGFTNQTWFTRKAWPKDDIKEKWNQGYKITELNYGNTVWAFVFSKGSSIGTQKWATRSEFPSAKIREESQEGFKVTEIAYGDGLWGLVMSKDSNIGAQKWFKRSAFPKEDLERYIDEGYAVTQLSYEDKWWVLVMSKYKNGSRSTKWFNSSSFPKEDINEYWKQGYHLTDVTYGRTGSSSTNNNYVRPSGMSSTLLKSKLVGRWVGGSVKDNENGTIIFNSNDIVEIITQEGERIGGENYYQEGIKIDITYEVSTTTSPYHLDLVFSNVGTELVRLKGIVRFKDDGSFECVINSDVGQARPTSFTSPNLSVFRKN